MKCDTVTKEIAVKLHVGKKTAKKKTAGRCKNLQIFCISED